MSTIDQFIATVKTQGMMRSNRYTVQFGDVVNDPDNLRQIMMYCADVQLPGVSMSTAQLRTYGELREVPYEKLFGDINLTFYVDNNMNVKNYFDRWMGLIQDPYTRAFNYYVNYISQMIITVEDYSNNAQYDINLYECYPKSIGQIQMGYDQKDVMKLQVTMQYKYWTSTSYSATMDLSQQPSLTAAELNNQPVIVGGQVTNQRKNEAVTSYTEYSVGNPMGDVSGYGSGW